MNKDDAQRLSDLVSSLRADLLTDAFEQSLLRELSALLRPSLLVFAHRRRDGGEPRIQLCRLRAGQYQQEEVDAAGFAERFGFSFHAAPASPPVVMEGPPGSAGRIVMSCQVKRHDCAVVTDSSGHPCLSGDMLPLMHSTLGLLLQARYAVRDTLKKLGPDTVMNAGTLHRISGVVSAITGAAQMLLSPGYSDDDREELRRLAQKGISELTDILEAMAERSV